MQWKYILRGAAAMIVGYGVIVCLTFFGFNVVLGGCPLYGGSPVVLGAGMMVAVVSGLLGGYIAGRIGAGRGLVNAALVLFPVTIDTIYVLFFFKSSTAPFWFDAMASGNLMSWTLLGGLISERSPRRQTNSCRCCAGLRICLGECCGGMSPAILAGLGKLPETRRLTACAHGNGECALLRECCEDD